MARQIETAIAQLVKARQTGERIAALNISFDAVEQGHAVQDQVAATLGEPIGGYKANAPPGEPAVRGAIYARTIFPSPARLAPALVPGMEVEGEIAFCFLQDLPARDTDYTRQDVTQAVAALPAIEVVSSRLADWRSRPQAEQLADNMNNGALVTGAKIFGWTRLEIANLHVTAFVNGEKIVEHHGGHPINDPLGVALALVNIERHRAGVKAGQLVTTGSCTGIRKLRPGDRFTVGFAGLGTAELVLDSE